MKNKGYEKFGAGGGGGGDMVHYGKCGSGLYHQQVAAHSSFQITDSALILSTLLCIDFRGINANPSQVIRRWLFNL